MKELRSITQVRIYRIQRDIPMPLVSSGVEKGNLRELALARMGQLGTKCRDVRTREAGIQDIHHQVWSRTPSFATSTLVPSCSTALSPFLTPTVKSEARFSRSTKCLAPVVLQSS